LADLINLSDTECEIVDFKTGDASDDHVLQISIYGLLWAMDSERNPAGRPATRLTISYVQQDVEVPAPSGSESQSLKDQLRDRTEAALSAINERPPEARPSLANCRYCEVRQICDDYWSGVTQRRLASEARTDSELIDLEAVITGRHGPTSWDGVIETSPALPSGRRLLFRTGPSDLALRAGDRIRILDAYPPEVRGDESDTIVIISCASTEVFFA